MTITGTGVFDDRGFETTTPVDVPVEGCRHRPLSAQEAAEVVGDVATQVWKTTAPPEAAAVAARSTGTMKVDGRTFHIIGGAQVFEDYTDPFKVTILSEIQGV
ncbi:hypothetical protein [Mycolicibacterium canariasense]|uniref:hypothetical protein n=1 Tax=Mycolicibacterium canariasense TaxID=228230 RepID=UPI0032D5A980